MSVHNVPVVAVIPPDQPPPSETSTTLDSIHQPPSTSQAPATATSPSSLPPPLPPRSRSSHRANAGSSNITSESKPETLTVSDVGAVQRGPAQSTACPPVLPPRRADVEGGRGRTPSVHGGSITTTDIPIPDESLTTPIPITSTTTSNTAPPLPPRSAALDSSIANAANATVATTTHLSTLERPPTSFLIITPLLLVLVYARVNLLILAVVCSGSWWLWAEIRRSERDRMEKTLEMPKDEREAEGKSRSGMVKREKESVNWMNHALRTLWPVLSTDMLTPFIDLLEDAMISQVPPIISSVRLTSPSLGNEPFVIDSMRVMQDSEWFEHLSTAKSAPTNTTKSDKANILSRKKSSSSTAGGIGSGTEAQSIRSYVGSEKDEEHRHEEATDRQRRDSASLNIGGQRGQGAGMPQDGHGTPHDRAAHKVNDEQPAQNTGRGQSGFNDDRDLQGDGQFVNFEVDFSFDGRENKNAWSLHFICYMGFGLKGIGGTELPVWIDLMQVRGRAFVRLQLSSSPPFVRTGSFTMPFLPSFDISAKPLKKFDVMNLPLTKSFMMKSIREVADTFVTPKSYTMDLDRLLLGQEASLRTNAIGVLQIRLHRCQDLRAMDALGTSDPYVTVSFSKYDRPLYSTRTIVKSLNPRWEEDAFILVDSDHVANGEHVVIRIYDSDRFSSDDSLGMVRVDLLKLVETPADGSNVSLQRQTTTLTAEHAGMKVGGTLDWSWGFFPIHKMPSHSGEQQADVTEEEFAAEKTGATTGRKGDSEAPGLLYKLMRGLAPEPFEWEQDRRQRRLDNVAWLTGQRAREAMEASLPPTEDYRSGILNFHIHQATDLQMETSSGTFHRLKSKNGNGAIGGRPTLEDSLDTPAWDTKKPPSAYCEVILNGRVVFRTRTKQLSPAPYWNATSERFIRDWTKARLVIVVRDERDREHDPVIGLVAFDLSSLFNSSCQVSRLYPLQAGLGRGHLRLSLLFKAVELQLPHNVSGFELATIDVLRLSTPASLTAGTNGKDLVVQLQTDADGVTLDYPTAGGTNGHSRSSSLASLASVASKHSKYARQPSSTSLNLATSNEPLEWLVLNPPRSLAVQYLHSCSLLLKFTSKNGKLKKEQTLGMSVIHLTDLVDDEKLELSAPVFRTDDVNLAWERSIDWRQANQRGQVTSAQASPQAMINITILLRSGISRAHRRLAKRDKRLMHVYEAWKLAQDVGVDVDLRKERERERRRQARAMVREQAGVDGEGGQVVGVDETSDESGESKDGEWRASSSGGHGPRIHSRPSGSSMADTFATGSVSSFHASQGQQGYFQGERILNHGEEDESEEEELEEDGSEEEEGNEQGEASFYRKWRNHSKALHRRNKGIMQNKIARTGRLIKDTVQAKVLQTADIAKGGGGSLGKGTEVRQRGREMEMEVEGQSKM